MRPAIVLSGHTMGLGVARALGVMGVPVVLVHYDDRDMAHVSRHVKVAIRAPHPEYACEEFIALLLDAAKRFAGGVLMPASDESLVVIAKYKGILEKQYIAACPDWETVRRCIDKKLTYALAEAHGVPSPKTILPQSRAEVEDYAATAEFPCLVKPSQSHLFYDRFKQKMFRVDTVGQMLDIWQQAADAGLEVLLQEIIPGDDAQVVNYNAYAWGGRSLLEFTAAHVRNAPPWFGSPRVVVSQDIPEVLEPGRKILQALEYEGYACTEFKKDARNGIYKLMEVNARHNLSTLLAVHCGINFPWLQYRHLTSGELPAAADYRKGIYWVDITRDIGYSGLYLTRERYPLSDYLRPYVRPHIFAILDWRDIRPFLRRVSFLGCQFFGKVFGWLPGRRRQLSGAQSSEMAKF